MKISICLIMAVVVVSARVTRKPQRNNTTEVVIGKRAIGSTDNNVVAMKVISVTPEKTENIESKINNRDDPTISDGRLFGGILHMLGGLFGPGWKFGNGCNGGYEGFGCWLGWSNTRLPFYVSNPLPPTGFRSFESKSSKEKSN